MEFLKNLTESEDSKKIKELGIGFGDYENHGMRGNNALIIGDIALSIQASYAHYCLPRKTIDLDAYTHMEMAIIKEGEFLSAGEVVHNKELAEKLDEHFDTVFSCVPVELIEELYQDLKKHEGQ